MIDFVLNNASVFVGWMLMLLVVLLIVIAVSAMYFNLLRKDFLEKFRFFGKGFLFVSIVLVWLSGLFLYIIGFYREGLNFVSVMPDALITSFKMFLMQNQVGRVQAFLREDVLYMSCFTLTHFVAALMSVMFVMRLIGFRIKMAMSLWFCANVRRLKEKNINVFWGMNESSYLLAESIYREKKRKNEYIFINTNNDEYEEGKLSLSSIFDVVNIDSAVIRRISKIRAYVATCDNDIESVTITKKSVLRKLRLSLMARIINRSRKTRVFFLSNDENYNINGALKLMKDKYVINNDVTIYVHACSEKMNDIYNHYSMYSGEHTKLKVVDSSYLSVAKLKLEPAYHPVNFVDVDPATATVVSPSFNALILGCGETAIEAFHFLYEFASFVDKEGNKVPFRCDMLAENISSISQRLRMQMPAIGEDELCMHDCAIDSKAYCDLLDRILPTLNYVVIALNDDDLGMYAAMEIYKRAMYLRNNQLKHFGIFVRCYDIKDYTRMFDLACRMTSNNKDSQVKITIFGRQTELYTYDLVIRERLLKQAMKFHKSYDEVTGAIDLSSEEHWSQTFGQENINRKLSSQLSAEPTCAKWHIIQDFVRQKEQNMSNSLHMATKYKLLGIDKHSMAAYQSAIKTRCPEAAVYNSANPTLNLKLLNLAKCEHIRWESSHKLLGYVCGEKSLIKKQHPCLVPWNQLSELLQAYDCNVVDTSIRMYENRK